MVTSVCMMREACRVIRSQGLTWEAFARWLGQELQRARIAKGFSQERVAHMAGLTGYTYQKLEKGESRPGSPLNPQLKTLIAVCQALELSPGDLLSGELPDMTEGR